jgi:hypothetical protein
MLSADREGATMITYSTTAVRRRMHGRERGAATLETVGMYSVAAVLAVAVMLVLASATPVIGDRLRQALCMVTTLGQGSCEASTTSAFDHKPTAPCVVNAEGHTGAVEATVVVTLGTSEKILVETLNNGKFRVTRGTGGKVGFGVGAGANFTATWDSKTFGGAAKADASLASEFSGGDVYYANNMDEVKILTRAHSESVAKDALLGSTGLSFLRPLIDKAEEAVGVGNLLPPPDEVYVEAGVSGELKAQATGLIANAQAGGSAKGVLGTRLGADGTSTTYIQASTDGNVSAGTWAGDEQTNQTIYAKAGLEGKVEGIVEVERDAKGNITAVRYKTVLSGTAEAGEEGGTVSDGPGKKQGYMEKVVELPIKSTTDQTTAQRYLNALGMGPLGGFPDLPQGVENFVPIVNPLDAVSAAQAFAKASGDRGFITRQTFDNDKSASYGIKAEWEEVLKVSGGGTVETVDRTSTGAQYLDGDTWTTWKGCGEK